MEDRERTNQIQALKVIFDKAKTAPKMGQPGWSLEFENDLFGAVIDVGKQRFYELKDEIYPYLHHEDPAFRAQAVATLGFSRRLKLPDFKDKAYGIWLKDKDEEVKRCALDAWGGYYSLSHDSQALFILYHILINRKNPISHRVTALANIIEIGDDPIPRELYQIRYLGDLESQEELDKAIDWARVNRIMKTYAPDALREHPK